MHDENAPGDSDRAADSSSGRGETKGGMDENEIRMALQEAARQTMLEILEGEAHLVNMLSDLPETELIISIIKTQLDLEKGTDLPADLNKEQIIKVSKAITNSLGPAITDAFKEIVKQPKLMKALKKLFSTHSEDYEDLDPLLSRRYADVLLDFAERYMETPAWKKTQAVLIITESLVKNVTGAAKPRLYARMDMDWGIYLWKCGDYSWAGNRLEKAQAGITALLKKHGKEITDRNEIRKNKELQARGLLSLGILYGDYHEDKGKAIGFYEESLSILEGLEDTYRNKKMRARLLNNLGVTHQILADIDPEERSDHLNESSIWYDVALSTARSIRDLTMVGWILFNAGEVHAMLGDLDKAEEHSAESRRIFSEETPSDRGMSGVEMLDALIHLRKGDHAKALECINRSIELREEIGEPRRIADAVDSRGDIHLAAGEKYKALEDYKQANAIYRSIDSEAGIKKTEAKMESLA
ncbi:MAG: hypothetical protein AYK23_03620 [Candidatus Proteinoplasmatales archaeon SG8-5]|nr:MAG: hypothetical protein AYK23_03620 [Candidatus Proteinoplasmatales archaeon SG8-5]